MHQSIRSRHEESSPSKLLLSWRPSRIYAQCPFVSLSGKLQRAGSWCNTHTQSLSSAAQWSGKTNPACKTKGEHLSAKPWQDFEVISHASSERPTLMLRRTPLKQWRTPMEIIVKRVPEHIGCPTGSAAMNSCLFLLWKRLPTVSETLIGYFSVFFLFFFSLSVMRFHAAWHVTIRISGW